MNNLNRLLLTLLILSLFAGYAGSNPPAYGSAEGWAIIPTSPALEGESSEMFADVAHCTVIYAADNELALAGNNEDWDDPSSKVWFSPPTEGKYGVVYFGFDESVEGGMNDQGLFFDATATAPLEVVQSRDKPRLRGYLPIEVMETCATVEEALAVFDQYNLEFMSEFQVMFGDRNGDSAIIEGDVILRKQGRYQVLTNFYQSQYEEGSYPCYRYNTAVRRLERAPEISVELFRDILDATHQIGRYPTQYSNVYDLRQGMVYVYYLHDFERVVELNLAEELEKGAHDYDLPSLFSESDPEAVVPLPDAGGSTVGPWGPIFALALIGMGLALRCLLRRTEAQPGPEPGK